MPVALQRASVVAHAWSIERRVERSVRWILEAASRGRLSDHALRALLHLVAHSVAGKAMLRPREVDPAAIADVCPEHVDRPAIGAAVVVTACTELEGAGLVSVERSPDTWWYLTLAEGLTTHILRASEPPREIRLAKGGQQRLRWSADEDVEPVDPQALVEQARHIAELLAVQTIRAACQSPIEERFVLALLALDGFAVDFDRMGGRIGTGPGSSIFQQYDVEVGGRRYRLDFVIAADAADVRVAVETDGHDFHERTPEQASRDKARDRALQAAGWRILRFTGRDVHRDAARCARESAAFVAGLLAP